MKIKWLAYLMIVLCLCSCAHKSGHGGTTGVTSNTHRSPSRKTPTAPTPSTPVTETPSVPQIPSQSNDGGAPSGPSIGIDHNDQNKLDGKAIFQRYNPAVFMVHTSDGHNYYQGSGFFIDNNGLAVSNYHVFEGTTLGREQIILSGSDRTYKISEVIKKSYDDDFILFRVDISNTTYIPIAKSKPLIGETVYALGSPKGMENTLSTGLVSQWREENLMQISVPIDHGSSGGALINEYGEVVGITTLTFDESSQANLNGAMSIDVVKPYLK